MRNNVMKISRIRACEIFASRWIGRTLQAARRVVHARRGSARAFAKRKLVRCSRGPQPVAFVLNSDFRALSLSVIGTERS